MAIRIDPHRRLHSCTWFGGYVTPGSSAPDLSIVIPTHERPEQLIRAVHSALAQADCDVEVIVVNDGSRLPLSIPPHLNIQCLQLDHCQGPAAARNAGLAVARGRYVTFLDDDDQILPHMGRVSLAALASSDLPSPVAVISAIEVVDRAGNILERRLPPSYCRGSHFSLEPLPPGCSHVTKNTLVVSREILLAIGGFDPALAACEWIDLFLRLNSVCSICGISTTTYRLTRGGGQHFSRDMRKRWRGFSQLERKHRQVLAAHPRGHADALLGEARMALAAGSIRLAVRCLCRAFLVAPAHAATVVLSPIRCIRSVRGLHLSG